MLFEVRSEGVARNAALLALLLSIEFICIGCRTHAPLAPPAYYVRLDVLMRLHPAWAQIRLLEETAARVSSTQPNVVALHWSDRPLPQPFVPSSPPAYTNPERQKPIDDYTRRYLAEQAANLALRNQKTLAREEKAERKRLNVILSEAKARLMTDIRAQRRAQAQQLDGKIRALSFRDAALLSQVRVYTGQSRLDAQRQRDQVGRDVLALQRQQNDILADIEPEVNRQLEPQRASLEAAFQARIQKRSRALEATARKLDQEMQDRLVREAAGSGIDAEAIPAAGSTASVVDSLKLNSLSLPSNPTLAVLVTRAEGQVADVSERRRAQWQRQQVQLLAVIRSDTEQAVRGVASRQGWRLVRVGSPHASDATDLVAPILRSQWRSEVQNEPGRPTK